MILQDPVYIQSPRTYPVEERVLRIELYDRDDQIVWTGGAKDTVAKDDDPNGYVLVQTYDLRSRIFHAPQIKRMSVEIFDSISQEIYSDVMDLTPAAWKALLSRETQEKA